jgi:hypothetical protein
VAVIEHVLSDQPGTWRETILGSRGSVNWEMKVEGPKGFERLYTLTGKAGEHEPSVIAAVLAKLIPPQGSLVDRQTKRHGRPSRESKRRTCAVV